MRVGLVMGPCPEGRCGVGDYTRLLATALEAEGLSIGTIQGSHHGARLAFEIRDEIKAFRPDIIHLQYPTAGFGKGLAPQILALFNRHVLTVHEMEGAHLLRRLSCYPLWLRARHVVFTCESNRRYSLGWAPWLRGRSSVIPLSTNIPARPASANGRALAEVVHFGLVRPNKGIEAVLEFTNLAVQKGLELSVRIVGTSQKRHSSYLLGVRRSAAGLPVAWDMDLSAEGVAERLARATLAYLPFPDGASERRGSLLAALANGVPVITTAGKSTPSGYEDLVRFCSSPAEAVAAARALIETPSLRENLAVRGRQFAERFTWKSIAQAHLRVYQQILATNAHRD